MKNLNHKQRLALFTIIILVIFSLVYTLVNTILRAGKIATTVKFAPFSATVSLNGTAINNNSTTYLLPGSYHLIVRNEHFSTHESDITIDEENHYIIGTLTASDEQGTEYTKTHRNDFIEVEGLVGKISVDAGNRIKQKYPILKYLPINNSLYSISYAYDNNLIPIINVKSSLKYLDAAVAKLKSFENVDLITYSINFSSENPYTKIISSTSSDPDVFVKKSFASNEHIISPSSKLSDDYRAYIIYSYDYNNDLNFAHYRVLIKKTNDSWQLISTPTPLFTKENTKNTPEDILKKANELSIY